MSKFQIAVLVPMLLLTFTVGIYDYRLFNMKVLGIEVWAHGQYEEGNLGSWDPVVNITNHPLKEKMTYYMNKSIQGEKEDLVGTRGQRIYIFDPEIEAFFGKYYVSTWCGTCQMEMSPHFIDGNTYYYVLLYYSQLQPSLLEACLACAVSIATAILWLFYWAYVSKFKPESSREVGGQRKIACCYSQRVSGQTTEKVRRSYSNQCLLVLLSETVWHYSYGLSLRNK